MTSSARFISKLTLVASCILSVVANTSSAASALPLPETTNAPGPHEVHLNDQLGADASLIGDAVHVANGNWHHETTDLSFTLFGAPFGIRRTYNSHSTQDRGFGIGWSHNFDMPLIRRPDGTVMHIDEDGTQSRFRMVKYLVYDAHPSHTATLSEKRNGAFTIRRRDGTTLEYAKDRQNGRLAAIVDRNRNTITLAYDDKRRLSVVTDPFGRSLTFSYNDEDRIAAIEGPAGRKVAYAYDDDGNLVQVQDAAGGVHHYAYDTRHRMTMWQDPAGAGVALRYTEDGRLREFINPLGHRTSYAYFDMTTVMLDAGGATWQYDYDANGRIIRIVDPNLEETTFEHDALGRNTAIELPNCTRIRYRYDGAGNRVGTTDQGGTDTTAFYDPRTARIQSEVDNAGAVTDHRYDQFGNLTTVVDAYRAVTSMRYNDRGQMIQHISPSGVTTTLSYDSAGNLHEVAYPFGVLRFTYDQLGNVISMVDTRGFRWQAAYDPQNRLVSVTTADGRRFLNITYDAAGNVTSTRDSYGRQTTYAYDDGNRLVSVRNAGGQTSYTYDKVDNIIGVEDARGRKTVYFYDQTGRLTYERDVMGHLTTFTYDDSGNVIRRTDPNGNSSYYQYDARNQLVATKTRQSRSTYSYDATGLLTEATTGELRLTFAYDLLGRLVEERITPGNRSYRHAYDTSGNRVLTERSDSGRTNYHYDNADRLIGIDSAAGTALTIHYDGVNRWARVEYDNNCVATQHHDPLGHTITSTFTNSAAAEVMTFSYTRDAAGRPTAVADLNGRVDTCTYDRNGRPTHAQYADGDTMTVAYDASGSAVNVQRNEISLDLEYNRLNRLEKAGYRSFEYDNNGNLIASVTDREKTRYAYDSENRLVEIVYPDGSAVTFTYDPLGRLIRRTGADGAVRHMHYDGWLMTAVGGAANDASTRYTIDPRTGVRYEIAVDKLRYLYIYDGHSAIGGVFNDTGPIIHEYLYDLFGAVRDLERAFDESVRLWNYRYDPIARLYVDGPRYLDPEFGQYLNPDAVTGVPHNGAKTAGRDTAQRFPLPGTLPVNHRGILDSMTPVVVDLRPEPASLIQAQATAPYGDVLVAHFSHGRHQYRRFRPPVPTAVIDGPAAVLMLAATGNRTLDSVSAFGRMILNMARRSSQPCALPLGHVTGNDGEE